MRFRLSSVYASRPAQEIARFWRCDLGTNAIEFAFVFPMIVVIVLATLQVSVIFVAQAYLEEVAEAGKRTVMTNQANNMTQAQFTAAICAEVAALFNCSNMIVELEQAPSSAGSMQAAMPTFKSDGTLTTPTTFTTPLPAPANMLLVVMYQWPVISGPFGFNFGGLGNGTHLLASTQVFQVEPQTN